MAEKLYSIIMPTRERADVLHFAIRTVLKLTRSNYELIVMDNCGSPGTRQVVEAFDSPHIRYFRSPTRLSMADNWEEGLSHATGDYITFLGDDDGILPDAIEIAAHFHAQHPDEILNWLPFTWLWPDSLASEYRNLAQMHFGRDIKRIDSRRMLQDVLAGRSDWTTLPTLYCSFVPRRIIEQVKGAHGRHFLASLPDVSSGITNLWSSEQFSCSDRPLTCWGLSRHSTGTSQYFHVGTSGQQFDRERVAAAEDAWHPRVSGADLIVEVRVADLYLKLKDKLFPDDDDLEFDMAALLDRVARRSAPRLDARREEVARHVEDMARRNGLDPARFPLAAPVAAPMDRFTFQIVPERGIVTFTHFTDPHDIATIEDFVEYAAGMCVPPLRIQDPADPVRGRKGLKAVIARLRRLSLGR